MKNPDNKILYETLLDFFTTKQYLFSEEASYFKQVWHFATDLKNPVLSNFH